MTDFSRPSDNTEKKNVVSEAKDSAPNTTETEASYSVLTELNTPSGMTLAFSAAGVCTLTDARGLSLHGHSEIDSAGVRSFSFDNGCKVRLTPLGTITEIMSVPQPSAGNRAAETSALLTPEGVLLKICGKEMTAKFPNGVFIDEKGQITDKRGSHSPDEITIDPDGTRNYALKRENLEIVYSVGPDGTASTAEKRFAKNFCLSEQKTQWTPNKEIHIKTRQRDTEILIRGVFVLIDRHELFEAPTGFRAERTPGGTLMLKVAGKTRTLKHGLLQIRNDSSGQEIEYEFEDLNKDPNFFAPEHGRNPPMHSLSDGTTATFITVSGDKERTENSTCLYISMPNNQKGRDHFFFKPHSNRFAYVSANFDSLLSADYDFQFGRKIFDD